jgi:hypothetical protein
MAATITTMMKQANAGMADVLKRLQAGEFATIDDLNNALDEYDEQMGQQMGGMSGMPQP